MSQSVHGVLSFSDISSLKHRTKWLPLSHSSQRQGEHVSGGRVGQWLSGDYILKKIKNKNSSLYFSISKRKGILKCAHLFPSFLSIHQSCKHSRTQSCLYKSFLQSQRMTSSLPSTPPPAPHAHSRVVRPRVRSPETTRAPPSSDSLPCSLLQWWYFEPNYQHLTQLLQRHKKET